MRRSTKKEVIDLIRQHIQDCVYDENGDEFKTYKKAAMRLASKFKRVANYPNNIHRYPNEFERFKDFMQGLPFNFEYMYYEQRKIVNEWLQTEEDKYTDQEAANQYYWLIYRTVKNFIK